MSFRSDHDGTSSKAPSKTGKYVPPRLRQEDPKLQQRQLRFSKPKPTPQYGFVSRGEDSRLQDSESARKEFFETVVERYNELFAGLDDLAESFSRMALSKPSSEETASILANLRKLREALLHKDPDAFTAKVYLLSVRLSAKVGHYQTYIPSISYLLRHKHIISTAEHREVATLLVLHTAHCNNQKSRSLELFHEHLDKVEDSKIFEILRSWIAGDYCKWIELYDSERGSAVSSILELGLPRMMAHMVNCLTCSYFTMSVSELQDKFFPKGVTIDEFQKQYSPTWLVEDGTVTLRKRGK